MLEYVHILTLSCTGVNNDGKNVIHWGKCQASDEQRKENMSLSGCWRSLLDPERMVQVDVAHWQETHWQAREDALTVEEPFEIRVGGQSLAVIMRTPGHDHELTLGFLLTEGVITQADAVVRIENALDADGLPLANVVDVTLRQHSAQEKALPAIFERHFAVSASCGVCGKNSIADLMLSIPPLEPDSFCVPAHVLSDLATRLREGQAVFRYTGGLHAAGLFTNAGELLLLREDVGRHNAVDKLIGDGLLRKKYPYQERLLLVSGRSSFEIIQKALLARIPCVAAISAPSSLAVELAEASGMTLVGFLRNSSFNVYTHPKRIL